MKLIESKDCQPPIIEAVAMKPGQTGIVTASSSQQSVPVGSLVMRAKAGCLVVLDPAIICTFDIAGLGSVLVQPHAPGTRLVFETV